MKNKSLIQFVILSTLVIFISCNQTKTDNVAYRISEKDLIPEGITYSSTTNSFYISSIKKKKIIQIDAKTGVHKDFISSDLLGMRFLGMIVDESKNHLWACGNKSKDGINYSTVARFNIKTGELIKSYETQDSIESIYNDLVQDEKGNVYFTNSSKQTVYKINQQTDSLTIFLDSDQISHPNGITISPDFKYLYIASNDKGIRILDIRSKKVINQKDSTIISAGLDGLKFFKNSVIGIQNEVYRHEMKIAQYFLDETGTKIIKMKIIDQNNHYFDIPTTFVIVSNQLYCLANSQMGNIDFSNFEIRSYEGLNETIILKYDL